MGTLFFILDILRESFKRAVVGALYLRRESAGGQLPHFQVVGDALAAPALARTGLVGAVAPGFIGFNVTFHTKIQNHKLKI
jgi:hypothetical protein